MIGQWFLAKSHRKLDRLFYDLLTLYMLVAKACRRERAKVPAAASYAGLKGKQAAPLKGAAPHGKGPVTSVPAIASWHLAFKSVHTVTTVAKLESACAKSETVLFAPTDVSDLEEGCAFLAGQPAAKVSVAFLQRP